MRDPIDVVADRLSLSIKNTNPSEALTSVAVMSYALSLIINMMLTTLLILLIGYFTDMMQETAKVLMAFAILRVIAKGIHLKSLTLCVVVTTSLITILSHVQISSYGMFFISFICILLIFLKSPAELKSKILCSGIILLFLVFQDHALIMGCFGQALTLINWRR
ncbi:accessory gene regulator B family protein [Paenibacillus agricola]|uniref:Accessory gene regulator B n=1 Tax=Paenibacillus agricola TaxID=2716264 RepID=A0ABX0JAB8_9BACL|nr:accessory gene regulator B family protein [Paenibacillus agricola]NHN32873.1 hypothetical protein [Paenibacillus agricola]